MVLIHILGIQRLSWIKKEQGERVQGLVADSEKQQDLGSLRKVQLRIERSYDRKFLRAKAELDTEQLLFNTPILITPGTWCKSKTNKLLQNLGSTTTMHER
jgi:hypothetical protein